MQIRLAAIPAGGTGDSQHLWHGAHDALSRNESQGGEEEKLDRQQPRQAAIDETLFSIDLFAKGCMKSV
jgi:hypothetical protein